MVGSEDKIEGSLGLSIPVVLNAAIEVYTEYTKTNGPVGAAGGQTATTKNTNNGSMQIPNSSSVFFGGRVNENIGFEAELNIYPTPAGLLNIKLPFVYDVGDSKLGAVIYSTAVYGPSFGLEVMNTGANAVHLFNQQAQTVLSAQQYIGTGLPAAGVDLIGSNENGFVVLGKWLPDQSAASGTPSANYLRIAATPGNLIPGFDFGVGLQYWSGTGASTGNIQGTVGSGQGFTGNPFLGYPAGITTPSGYNGVGGITGQPANGVFDTKASAIDAQLLGDVNGMPLTVIASYATAPSSGLPTGILEGFQGNIFNPGTATRQSFNMGAELGIIPERMTLQASFRRADSGFAIPGTSITNATDNALLFGATYALSLNVRADLTYVKYSGDLYNAASQAIQGAGYMGDNMYNLTIVAAF